MISSETWDDFIEAEPEPSRAGSAKLDTELGIAWEFTISPPPRSLPINVMMYIDLLPFVDMIKEGVMICYPEFERCRLHYHCIVYPTRERCGYYFEKLCYFNFQKGRSPFVIKEIVGHTSKGNPKYKILRKGNYRCMYRFNNMYKGEAIDLEKWKEYCEKHSEQTEQILGYSKVTSSILTDIKTQVKNKYNIEINFCGH